MAPPVLHLQRSESEDEWYTCYAQVKKLLQRHPDIDSIIFSTDLLASHPRMTVLDNKMQELSITCASLLVRILNNEAVANKIMILSDIVEREST